MSQSKAKKSGFTIVELMVSMSVLALMLFLINSIFNETSAAVTTGIQTSRAIAATRVLDATLAADAQAMVGPEEGGYIVIIQEIRPTTTMLHPETLGEFESKGIRTDQLLYIRDAGGLRSMTPNGSDSYLSTLVGDSAGYAKVWYGHVVRTLNDGSDAGEKLGDPGAGLDRIGSDWILGRQAMLFNPLDNRTDPPSSPADNPNQFAHAVNARFDADVEGIGSGFPGPKEAYMGVVDVTSQSYGPATDDQSLLYQLVDPSIDRHPAQDQNYLATAYPDPARRLRVNTNPDPDATKYASWSIGQGHGILTPNCSEFVVQFAADLNGNGKIDTEFGGGVDDGSNVVNGQAPGIFWYDTFARTPQGGNYPRIQWKPSSLSPAESGSGGRKAIPQPLIQEFSGNERRVFIFRADDFRPFTSATEPTSAWPYMIRIRYRLHDSRGRMMSNDPTALYDGYDNDGDGLADDEDPENDEDRISGRWFERIITVPRPTAK